MRIPSTDDTICALATPAGTGALAIIRVSGKNAFQAGNTVFRTKKGLYKNFKNEKTHTLHYGELVNDNEIIDEVLISVFHNPHSFTGEDSLEISCHGSVYIQQQILQLLQKHGARLAEPGEFTLRAFLNGKLDLAQAEAVSDLIASRHAAAHHSAINQLRGGYSHAIAGLRSKLVDFASFLELELDFAEEDVEFANRKQLHSLVNTLLAEIKKLRNTYDTGNAIKEGIPVVIAGKPNVGKSTLLNALLKDDKAIVSDIAGTTRDVIEDQLVVQGIRFRFMDTAGLRHSEDVIEKMGIERSYQYIDKARIILYLCDASQSNPEELKNEIAMIRTRLNPETQYLIPVINKSDRLNENQQKEWLILKDAILISALNNLNIDHLEQILVEYSGLAELEGDAQLVTNARHADALLNAETALEKINKGIETNLSTDLLALELKDALYHLGLITGEIYTDDLLANIFGKFCIGK